MEGLYIFHSIGETIPPIRFGVEIDNVQYRLFSYFPVGNDSSIAIHSYFPGTHSATKRLDTPPEELSTEEREIKISELNQKAKPGFPHKYTFHQSGVLTAKNKKGTWLENDKDIQSIPFSNINGSIRLCYFYPTIYSKYPIVRIEEQKHHNLFKLVGNIRKMPPIIEIYLCQAEYDLVSKLKTAHSGLACFIDKTTLKAKDIVVFTIFRQSPNPHFPKTDAVIIEYY